MINIRANKARMPASNTTSPRMRSFPTHLRTPALGERSFHLVVPRFPVEVIDGILAHLHEDKATLAACALTCQTWSTYSFQHLYDTIEVSTDPNVRFPGASYSDAAGATQPTVNEQCRRFRDWIDIAAPVDAMPLVRVFRIRGTGTYGILDAGRNALFNHFTELMSNLRRLEFRHVVIREDVPVSLPEWLTRFAGVRDLRVDHCHLSLTTEWFDLSALYQPHQWQLNASRPHGSIDITLQSLQLTNCIASARTTNAIHGTVSTRSFSMLTFATPLHRVQLSINKPEDILALATFLRGPACRSLAHLSFCISSALCDYMQQATGQSPFMSYVEIDHITPTRPSGSCAIGFLRICGVVHRIPAIHRISPRRLQGIGQSVAFRSRIHSECSTATSSSCPSFAQRARILDTA